jgi:hypothetical protein
MPTEQLQLAKWLPYKRDRNSDQGGRSFYFFDFDDNIMHLETKIIIFSKKDNSELELSSGELALEQGRVGKSGAYKDYYFNFNDEVGSFKYFRDNSLGLFERLRGAKQSLLEDVETALEKPAWEWHGPSWNHFFYAVLNDRPISIITARGHEPKTFQKVLLQLWKKKYLLKKPNILSIYPVTNPGVRDCLGDRERKLLVSELKRIALIHSVEKAFKIYGNNPAHRFGVSDDDKANILQIESALAELKTRYPQNCFFVIDTSGGKIGKTEVFADHQEPSEEIELADALNYQLFDF